MVAEEGEHERLGPLLRALRRVQDVVVLHEGKGTAARRRAGGRPSRRRRRTYADRRSALAERVTRKVPDPSAPAATRGYAA
ncbi:hypothetical protein SNE510_08170 [Streptomyces sp. NE5-10]|nr:hypothetical protein SNE510_08170 [Streptomyces sp. NE5-10]